MLNRFRLPAALLLASAMCPAQDYVDTVVERARKEFDVPGIAVAIVKDGSVVLAKGYGVRRQGESAPVTAQSLFRIASNTKAFTAAALAMLVDQRRIAWDDPVTQHMPGFQLYDPYVTREMTIRDLLTHRSGLGLGAGDLMFFPPGDLGRDDIIKRLRFIKPATSFRSAYAYDNLLYIVAGQLIPAITGQTWDEFVRARIFTPLGMTNTFTDVAALKKGKDVATPHNALSGKLEPLPQEDMDTSAPAGAIISCVEDLAKWMIVQLNGGTLGAAGTAGPAVTAGPAGRTPRLFSPAQAKEMWSAQTILPIEELPKDAPAAFAAIQPNFHAYGLGWGLSDYRGKRLVGHTGGLSGYVSRTALVPELKLGIVILTNQEETAAHTAIANTIVDHYLGVPDADWVAAYSARLKSQRAEGEEAVKKAAGQRNPNTKPALPLTAYAGRYRDAWYGDIRIEEHDGKLSIYFTHTPDLAGDLEHWQYDTFVARWKNRTLDADAYVTFSLKPDGSIDEMRMKAVSPLTDFSFDFHDLLFHPVAINAAPK
ncbi:MAG: serine hydrolase [Candidatus Solibacter sp.]|jgi:CubicO group peptidase (beta-lactamase class C family)